MQRYTLNDAQRKWLRQMRRERTISGNVITLAVGYKANWIYKLETGDVQTIEHGALEQLFCIFGLGEDAITEFLHLQTPPKTEISKRQSNALRLINDIEMPEENYDDYTDEKWYSEIMESYQEAKYAY